MTRLAALLLSLLWPACVIADDRAEPFVEANVLAIFYHEVGHAAIDVLGLPVLAQEEDAADVLSVLLIDALYEPDAAEGIAHDAAFGFLAEAEEGGEPAFWDVHGPDMQRYFNLVCLFYGANPEEREDVAADLGLPEERADYCPDEYAQAAESWGAVIDELAENGPGDTLVLQIDDPEAAGATLLADVLGAELDALNAELSLPAPLPVIVARCDEANAFYDAASQSITMCTEFVGHLAAQIE